MGISLAKPRRRSTTPRAGSPRRSATPKATTPKKSKKCLQYECSSSLKNPDEYWDNSMFMILYDCRDSDATHNPECRALNRDPRFAKLYDKYKGPVKSKAPYLAKPDAAHECRLGDDFRRRECQNLLKTVHPRWSQKKFWK